MSYFYGVLQGQRGEATRTGSKSSGIHATAASWSGAISVRIFHDEASGKDIYEVYQSPWLGRGVSQRIASGVVGEEHPLLKEWKP